MFSPFSLRSPLVAALVVVSFAPLPLALADTFGISSFGNFSARISTTAPDPVTYSDNGRPPATLNYMSADEGYFLTFGPGITRPGANLSGGGSGSSSVGNGAGGVLYPPNSTAYLPPTWLVGLINTASGPGLLNGNSENGLTQIAGMPFASLPPVAGLWSNSSASVAPVMSAGGSAHNPVIVNPEPSSIVLFGTGLLGFGLWRCYRSNRPA